MSHYTVVETQFRVEHVDCLMKALTTVPHPVYTAPWREDQISLGENQALYGYRGDKRPEKAFIRIQRGHVQHSANDIGFTVNSDGTISAVISEYDKTKFGDAWMGALSQQYAKHVVLKEAPRGYQISEHSREDGTLVMRLVRA